MILKSLTRKTASFKQLLEYMMHDKDRYKDERGESFVLQHNVTGKTIKSWVKQFEQNEAKRLYHRSNSVKVYHDILSWSNKDTQNMSLEKIQDMAQKYIEIRNENALWVAVPHRDKDHWHVHFAMSGVEIETGKSSRVSREQFKEIKKELQQYQIEKYPELTHSIVDHEKSKKKEPVSEKEYQLTKRTKQPSERERTKELLTKLYKQSNSKEDFYKRIQDNGLKMYERGDKNYGIEGDRKMRFSTLGFDDKKIDALDVTLEFEKIRNAESDRDKDKDDDRNNTDSREQSDDDGLDIAMG